GTADVPGRTGQKNPHGRATAYFRSGPPPSPRLWRVRRSVSGDGSRTLPKSLHHNPSVRRETLIDFFDDLSSARGPFFVHDDGLRTRSFSYQEIGRRSRGFAARLHEAGLRKGDKVVFFSENRPEWIVAFWGCLLNGIVVVPIDYRSAPDLLIRVCRIVSAKLILIGQDVPAVRDASPASTWRLADFEWIDGAAPRAAIGRDDVAEI